MKLSCIPALLVTALLAPSLHGVAANGSFDEQNVRLIGRFTEPGAEGVSFTWPGSALQFRFRGTRADMAIAAAEPTRFWLEVDGRGHELWVAPDKSEYTLAQGLAEGEHEVRITRLAESFTGVTAFARAPTTDGELLPPPPAPERRLVVIGDSITAGYGVEGDSKECGYSQDTSNPLKAYAWLAADRLGADAHIIAWSGIGVWRSYGEEAPEAPSIAERRKLTLGDDFSRPWKTQKFPPDAVVVAIGTNDFWQGRAPGYQNAMSAMLDDLQSDYPQVPVYFTLSPMLSGEARQAQASDLRALAGEGVAVLDLGKIEPGDGYGCDWHPNERTNRRMADKLVNRLQEDLSW